MSQQKDLTPVGDVFYVDEEGDDFTFYLARDTDNTVFSKLAWAKVKEHLRVSPSHESPVGEDFSFSEKITVKRLGEIRDSFWRSLKKPKSESPYRYLLKSMSRKAAENSRSAIEAEKEIWAEIKAILKNLERGRSLSRGDKQKLRPVLTLALNRCVHQDNLKRKPWSRRLLGKLSEQEKKTLNSFIDEEKQRQWCNLVLIERAFPALKRKLERGRGLICFSHAGKYLSVTVRKLKEDSGYKASFLRKDQQQKRKQYLFSPGEYCQQIYEQVFEETDSKKHAHGLLVVTGSTNSLKSEIARGLIDLYLTNMKRVDRRFHLVTFEDPIEKQLYADEDIKGHHPYVAVALSQNADDINYTPRQKQKDVRVLKDALTDALRQTPALFFVGETRDKEEWEVLLDFAATGHLIVTTAHAGSLVEAMHKIFEALEVKTPADRSEIANKLLGVVHLRAGALIFEAKKLEGKSGEGGKSTNVLFPALWRRTPRGIAALTSDGLASLLPFRPTSSGTGEAESENQKDSHGKSGANAKVDTEKFKRTNKTSAEGSTTYDAASCLGRRWFIERLIERLVEDKKTIKHLKKVFDSLENIKTQAYRKAIEWDLQGA